MSGAGGGFAGTVDGSFFKAPGWVDLKKAPGTSVQNPTPWGSWFQKNMTGQGLIFSPNLVWLLFAVFDWFVFPYDLDEAKTFQSGWVLRRFAINYAIVIVYYGFWHGALYKLAWGTRKYRVDTAPSFFNLAHNIWYTTLGTFQFTVWEAIFLNMYATGKLGFVSNAELFANPTDMMMTVFWIFAIPLWRGLHFYFSHRLLHVRVLYKYVHSLHHRNTDIEPFAGMAMHPVEHLYYFSCLAPSIYFRTSPAIMLWNGMHLLLSPAASHSGFEDHMQSDQFHYIHHAKFECNYGSASFPLDHWFGTFRDSMTASKTYKGEFKDTKVKPAPFKTASSTAMQLYFVLTAVEFAVVGAAILGHTGLNAALGPVAIASIAAFGPLFNGLLLRAVYGDVQPMSWPFHKENFIGSLHQSFGFNLAMGVLVGVMPVFHFVLAATGDCAVCA